MADLQLGLEVAFYLYPVGLFTALFAAQLVAYRYRHAPRAVTADSDKDRADSLRNLYARLVYIVQLILTPALVCFSLPA